MQRYDKNIPLKLYKFQALDRDGYSIKNLKRNQIWFSIPAKPNDPFDFAIPLVLEWTDKDFDEIYYDQFNKLNIQGRSQAADVKELFFTNGKPRQSWKDHIYKAFEYHMRLRTINQISKMGVARFTGNLDYILMWSHYANGHKRFCAKSGSSCHPFLNAEQLRHVIFSEKYQSLPFSYCLQKDGIPDNIFNNKIHKLEV